MLIVNLRSTLATLSRASGSSKEPWLMLRPCLSCGVLTDYSYCREHRPRRPRGRPAWEAAGAGVRLLRAQVRRLRALRRAA